MIDDAVVKESTSEDPSHATRSTTQAKAQAKSKAKYQPRPQPVIPSKGEPTSDEIVKCWGSILSFTSIVHVVPGPLQCEYCAKHIADQAPDTARALVKLSDDHPQLASALGAVTKFFGGVSAFGLIGELYAPTVIHHGPYIPLLTDTAPMLYPDMPARKKNDKSNKSSKHQHDGVTPNASPATAGRAPTATVPDPGI